MRDYFMKSERLGFSIFTEDDYDLARELWLNENVTKLISATGKFSEEDVKKRFTFELNNQKQYQVQYWPIFLLETGEFVGVCGLRPYDLTKNIYEIGTHLLDKFWRQGF